MDARFFQALLTFSPVSGVVPGDKYVGQIVLRDINWHSGEAEVGYILFEPGLRRRGIGTKALALLQTFVVECTRLTRLITVTSSDNRASQWIAQKCGFMHTGSLRDDPTRLVFQWNVPSI
jgi:RimJ/RimL family protein N-acetyltransferase